MIALALAAALTAAAASPQAAPKVGAAFRDCPDCPQMVVLPPGSFLMGSPPSDPHREPHGEEEPQHRVTIGYALAVGRYEITREQYAAFVRATHLPDPTGCNAHNPPRWPNVPGVNWHNTVFEQSGAHPAICVSWAEAVAYTKWLSARTGQTYRLLSEAEWEYAARSGTQTQAFWGDSPGEACLYSNGPDATMLGRFPDQRPNLPDTLPCDDHYVFTSPVGAFRPSPWGLYDMMGNVFEWVQDCWWKNYEGAPMDGSPRLQGECWKRVNRGGSWTSIPTGMRAAGRGDDQYTTTRVLDLGFRVAREVDPARRGR
jgi:formylglycine-generating enzyme required for sulfatase activity